MAKRKEEEEKERREGRARKKDYECAGSYEYRAEWDGGSRVSEWIVRCWCGAGSGIVRCCERASVRCELVCSVRCGSCVVLVALFHVRHSAIDALSVIGCVESRCGSAVNTLNREQTVDGAVGPPALAHSQLSTPSLLRTNFTGTATHY